MHGRDREKEANLKLECGWCAHCREVNIVILNWQRPLWEGDQEVAKKSGRDEPTWALIHMYMEAVLGICQYSYLYLKLAKRYVFLIISYVFSSTKLDTWGHNRFCSETGWGGSEVAQAMYTHVGKCKIKTKKEKKLYWIVTIRLKAPTQNVPQYHCFLLFLFLLNPLV
jgi:hypothetical protein